MFSFIRVADLLRSVIDRRQKIRADVRPTCAPATEVICPWLSRWPMAASLEIWFNNTPMAAGISWSAGAKLLTRGWSFRSRPPAQMKSSDFICQSETIHICLKWSSLNIDQILMDCIKTDSAVSQWNLLKYVIGNMSAFQVQPGYYHLSRPQF